MSEQADTAQPSPGDSLIAALKKAGADRPESRVLDPLVGRWRSDTAWEPVPGKGVRHMEGTVEVGWIIDGRGLEMRSFDPEGSEGARVLLAFDPSGGDYVAFSVTVLSSFFTLERGTYDADGRRLVLDGQEPAPNLGKIIDYRRTITLVDDDTFTVEISYPGVPPGTYGPMLVTNRRQA
jgi:hypothetical protein